MGYWKEFNAAEHRRDYVTAIGVGGGMSITAIISLVVGLILGRGVDALADASVFLLMGVPPLVIGLRRRARDQTTTTPPDN